MERVLPAVRAELHQLKAFGRVLFLRQRVVPIQTLGANQKNPFPSHKTSMLNKA